MVNSKYDPVALALEYTRGNIYKSHHEFGTRDAEEGKAYFKLLRSLLS